VLFNLLYETIDKKQIQGKESDFYKVIRQVNEQYPSPKGEPPFRTNK
jgi:hypothetical protein